MALNLSYYYGNEAEQFTFYRVPKALFTDTNYQGVSVEAKVLYGLLLDRMALSVKNGWMDSDGKVYIYFTLEDALSLIGCGKDKAVKLFKELDIESGIGLIERKKQGQGKPVKIYVKNFIIPKEPMQTSEKPKSELRQSSAGTDQEPTQTRSSAGENRENAEVKTSEKPKSALLEKRSLDFGNSAPNNTDINKTDLNDINLSIPPADANEKMSVSSKRRMDMMDTFREQIKKNIDYDILILDSPFDRERIDGYVDIIVDVCSSGKSTIRINQEDMPAEAVKDRLLTLDSEHIRYVMDCLNNNGTPIKNIRAYILSALYNAPATMSQYYANLVNRDMARCFSASP